MTIINPTREERQKAFNEQTAARGIFVPLRTCPLKNGIGIWDDEGNYCHKDCAWARTHCSLHCLIYGLQTED